MSMRQKPKKIFVSYFWPMITSSNIDCVNNCYKNMKVENVKENTNEVFWGPTLLIFVGRHDFQSCILPFLSYKCVWVFLWFAKKLQNPFDMSCISQCFFKVSITWKWYGYYIKFLGILTFANASWQAWLSIL